MQTATFNKCSFLFCKFFFYACSDALTSTITALDVWTFRHVMLKVQTCILVITVTYSSVNSAVLCVMLNSSGRTSPPLQPLQHVIFPLQVEWNALSFNPISVISTSVGGSQIRLKLLISLLFFFLFCSPAGNEILRPGYTEMKLTKDDSTAINKSCNEMCRV